MKTLHIKKLKSGNYEISDRHNFTEKFNTKKGLLAFWTRVTSEKSTTWNRHDYTFKVARIVKSRYRMSTTYFGWFEELYNYYK